MAGPEVEEGGGDVIDVSGHPPVPATFEAEDFGAETPGDLVGQFRRNVRVEPRIDDQARRQLRHCEPFAEVAHRWLRSRSIEPQDAASHLGIDALGDFGGHRCREPQALEQRGLVALAGLDHAGDRLLTDLRGLPRLGHVVPDVVLVEHASDVAHPGAQEVGSAIERAVDVTRTPVVTHHVEVGASLVESIEFGDEPVGVVRHRRVEAVGDGGAESGRREPDDLVDSLLFQRRDERCPDRRSFRIPVDEDDGACSHFRTVARAAGTRSMPADAYGAGVEISRQSQTARRLASALEPVVGQVYFSPECHTNYVDLGFDPSPGAPNGVALPDGPAYFASRGSLLGHVPGEVIAAAFGVFSPAVVVPAVAEAWGRTDAGTVRAARADGAVGQLRRLLGDRPEGVERADELLTRATGALAPNGRPLAAGAMAWDVPAEPLARVWHLGDIVREFRGDSHNAAWVAAALTATEIGLLSELAWGMPTRSYSRTRGWSTEEFDRADARLHGLGYLDGVGATTALTERGRAVREQIEVATDMQLLPLLDVLGDEVHELIDVLAPWGALVRDGHGYPAAGPHDLAGSDG